MGIVVLSCILVLYILLSISVTDTRDRNVQEIIKVLGVRIFDPEGVLKPMCRLRAIYANANDSAASAIT